MLFPFNYAFYRKYGWESFSEHKKYELGTALLPQFPDPGGHVERVADWRLLKPIYDEYAGRYNGMLNRDELWWSRRSAGFKRGETAVFYDERQVARGYIEYQAVNHEMDIRELVFLDEPARRGLWRFIANHDSMIRKVMLKAPIDDALPFLLADARISRKLCPYFMARIVDLIGFIQQYPFAPGRSQFNLT